MPKITRRQSGPRRRSSRLIARAHRRCPLLSLPVELLEEIALYIRWRPLDEDTEASEPNEDDFTMSAARTRFNANRFDLCSFLRTCRYVRQSCEFTLYEALEVCMRGGGNADHSSCGGSLPLLLRTLDSRPDLARSVKEIALNLAETANEWEEGSLSREAAARLFRLCPNLRSLYCDTVPASVIVEADIRGLKALATTFRTELFKEAMAPYFQELENLVLEDVYFNDANAFCQPRMPKLKHLRLTRCLQQGATLLSSALSLPAENLEELVIHKIQGEGQQQDDSFRHHRLYGSKLKSLTLCGNELIRSIRKLAPQLWDQMPSLQLLVLARDKFLLLCERDIRSLRYISRLVIADRPPLGAPVQPKLEHHKPVHGRDHNDRLPPYYVSWWAKSVHSQATLEEFYRRRFRQPPQLQSRGSDSPAHSENGAKFGVLALLGRKAARARPISSYSSQWELVLDLCKRGEANRVDVDELRIAYQRMGW